MKPSVVIALSLIALGVAVVPSSAQDQHAQQVYARPTLHQAVIDGVAFLVKTQKPDGSWGTGTETRGMEIYSLVPGSHAAFRVGTTALCVMALREAGENRAHDRGV